MLSGQNGYILIDFNRNMGINIGMHIGNCFEKFILDFLGEMNMGNLLFNCF